MYRRRTSKKRFDKIATNAVILFFTTEGPQVTRHGMTFKINEYLFLYELIS